MRSRIVAPLLVVALVAFSLPNSVAQSNFKPQFMMFSEDNDFINLRGEGTDRHYTNGTFISLFYTKREQRKYLTSLLIPLNESSDNIYGIGIAQMMFTPNDISRSDIILEQPPYTGLLYLTHTLISSDHESKQKLTTEMKLGVIGPWSQAKEIQTWVHSLINYQKPMGWDNQVKNDIIFNYRLTYEKRLLSPSPKFELIGLLGAEAGTLNNQITTGGTFRMGKYNSYFSNYEKPGIQHIADDEHKYKKFQFYFFVRPMFTAFMDNSVLQGGMFTGLKSVHTIPNDNLTHYYMQFEYGFLLGTKRFGFLIMERLRTAMIKDGTNILFGNFTLFIGV